MKSENLPAPDSLLFSLSAAAAEPVAMKRVLRAQESTRDLRCISQSLKY